MTASSLFPGCDRPTPSASSHYSTLSMSRSFEESPDFWLMDARPDHLECAELETNKSVPWHSTTAPTLLDGGQWPPMPVLCFNKISSFQKLSVGHSDLLGAHVFQGQAPYRFPSLHMPSLRSCRQATTLWCLWKPSSQRNQGFFSTPRSYLHWPKLCFANIILNGYQLPEVYYTLITFLLGESKAPPLERYMFSPAVPLHFRLPMQHLPHSSILRVRAL